MVTSHMIRDCGKVLLQAVQESLNYVLTMDVHERQGMFSKFFWNVLCVVAIHSLFAGVL